MKERIIDAAINLIETGDPLHFSVAKVAKALGISQGNVTYYYPKREDLVESVVERLILRYTSTSNFDFESGKNKGELISKKFLRFLLEDARSPKLVKIMIFIWSNALGNSNIAKHLAHLYKMPVEVHLRLSGNEGTEKQSQTIYALLTITSIINGLVPIMGIANSPFNYEEYSVYLESLLSKLLF
ncbi:TetR/AcrR family transcriptional regulator [Shewanella oncorhynchi]|uniref:TetR/AcrR family transcriptional regulator n=1 Tax=Gammaproteobacteria TaxID=1236 RepID=UPI00155DF096|nr:TetR/AcrR family transcriptional regulator [Vibrio cholerae]EKO3569812.1 TetR/AcrR family transcriptional regulator [Vibrio metschnikovii]EKO3604527.1 TetR/AcrR family transcriptional regulator [Vibrio metschnikovii]EKQ5811865.1 TetR/AcrR family transcriptional regulator [Vibrio metschnikovii]NOF49560.1 TetR/AcrR family transcriptional regulator [Vibrio cholerae]